jgi:hypothetical protein
MDVDEESNLEEAKEDAPSLLLKCKTVGRLGPPSTKLDLASAFGSLKLVDQQGLRVVCQSSSGCIRANTAVFKNRYYFEVHLLSD